MSCAHCGHVRPIMFAMEGGWSLCSRCYKDGFRTAKPNPMLESMEPGTPMGRSLVTGERFIATDRVLEKTSRGSRITKKKTTAKQEVASFAKHPNAPDSD